ncbi:MAG TPA: hypothetical protein VGC99_03885, partial [Candidatus Tectomicrobia bacterium]
MVTSDAEGRQSCDRRGPGETASSHGDDIIRQAIRSRGFQGERGEGSVSRGFRTATGPVPPSHLA